MRILATKISILILPVLLVLGALYCTLPRDPTSYFHVFNLKNNLLKITHSPKIVLVGDSNFAFGVDSCALSRALKMNVVNASLHAGLGPLYLLNMVEERTRANGDIIIISFEYSLYSSESDYGGDVTLCELIFEEPAAAKYIGIENMPVLLSGLGRVCGTRLMRMFNGLPFTENPIYNSKAFNAYGDVVSHLRLQARTNLPPHISPATALPQNRRGFSPVVIRRLTRFIEHAESMGVHIYIVPAACRKKEYDAEKATIQEAYSHLKNIFPGKVLSDPEAFVFDNDCIFDTPFHLNNKGRDIRTEKLINIIRDAEIRMRQHE